MMMYVNSSEVYCADCERLSKTKTRYNLISSSLHACGALTRHSFLCNVLYVGVVVVWKYILYTSHVINHQTIKKHLKQFGKLKITFKTPVPLILFVKFLVRS